MKIFTGLRAFVLLSAFIPPLASASPLGDIANCVHSYWKNRLNQAVISADSTAAQTRASWLPSLVAIEVGQRDLIAQPPDSQTSGNIEISETIFDLHRTYLIDATDHAKQGAQADLESQLLNLMTSAQQVYSQYLTAIRELEIYKERQARLAKFLNLVRELARLRVTDQSNAFALEAEYNQTTVRMIQLQSSSEMALSQLKAAVAVSSRFDPSINTPSPQLGVDVAKISSQLSAIAENLPNAKGASRQAENFRDQAQSARMEFVPTLSLSFTYSPSGAAYIPNNASIAPGTTVQSSGLAQGLLTWNIFDQGSQLIRASHDNAQASSYELLMEARKKQNELEISSLLRQFDLDTKALSALDQGHILARKAFDAAYELYSVGKTSFLAVRDYEQSLANIELQQKDLQQQQALVAAQLELDSSYEDGKYREKPLNPALCSLSAE
jgi:outer membrane protein TolC